MYVVQELKAGIPGGTLIGQGARMVERAGDAKTNRRPIITDSLAFICIPQPSEKG